MLRRRRRGRTGFTIALAGVGVAVAGAAAVVARRRLWRESGTPVPDPELIVKRLLEEPWSGNVDVIDEYVAKTYVGHDPSEPEPIRGPAGVRAIFSKYSTAFTDGAITVDDQVVDGDKVASRWTGRGTHAGEIAGIAPTGREVTVSGLTISKLEGGRVVEEWTTWDTHGMLVQLGAVAEPATA